jgi:hypothetical protein
MRERSYPIGVEPLVPVEIDLERVNFRQEFHEVLQ